VPQYALLASGMTAATYPDPTTLTTKNPFPVGYAIYTGTVNQAWTSQAKKCLILPPTNVPYNQFTPKQLWLRFVPSQAGATYTVTAWKFALEGTTPVWSVLASDGSNSYTGEVEDYYDNFDNSPVYFQITSLSGGSITAYYDSSIAGVI
jgi:hypothetical protein